MSGRTLTLISADAALIRGSASFDAAFYAFEGHFPNNPILPAYCHIQLALDLLQLANCASSLATLERAKFTHAIYPGQSITIDIRPVGKGSYYIEVHSDAAAHSQFHLRIKD